MKYYSIGEFANKIGKTVQTLRNWDKKGTLKPHHITEGGTRYYSQEQLNHFLGLNYTDVEDKIDIIFLNTLFSICVIYDGKVSTECQCKLKMIKELIENDTCEKS